MAPGPGLDNMIQRAVDGLTSSLEVIRRESPATINLYNWVQHEVILATTDAEFGPGNPFQNSEFEEAW